VLAGYFLEAGRAEQALSVVNEIFPAQQRLVENDNPDNRDMLDYGLRNFAFCQTWAELLSGEAEALAKLGKPGEAAKVALKTTTPHPPGQQSGQSGITWPSLTAPLSLSGS
jgi:hypothetical protein